MGNSAIYLLMKKRLECDLKELVSFALQTCKYGVVCIADLSITFGMCTNKNTSNRLNANIVTKIIRCYYFGICFIFFHFRFDEGDFGSQRLILL